MKDCIVLFFIATLYVINCSMLEVRCLEQKENEGYECTTAHGNLTNDGGFRVRRETSDQEATKMTLVIFLSKGVVQILGKQNIIESTYKFLQSYSLNLNDIFHLELKHDDVVFNDNSHLIIFVLEPKNKHISDEIWSGGIKLIDVGGFKMHAHNHYEETVVWDGLKTTVSFDITTDVKVSDTSTVNENRKHVVDFITANFLVRINQMYDVILADINDGTARVEFSFAPAMNNLKDSLDELEAFVDDSCHSICGQNDLSADSDKCSTCDYLSLSDSFARPISATFTAKKFTWIGTEKRFDVEFKDKDEQESHQTECGVHQESCTNSKGTNICVGIGQCDKNFYRTLLLTIPLFGELAMIDLYGLDYVLTVLADVVHDTFGVCKNGLIVELFEHGRVSTNLRLKIPPYNGRTESLQTLADTLNDVGSITVKGLTITLSGDITLQYLDNDGPSITFIEDGCFGCGSNTVWCLLPEFSLCLPLTTCVEQTLIHPKFANSTDLVRVSILLYSGPIYVDITESFIEETRELFADQLNCSLNFLDNILMAPSEWDQYEIRLDVVNQGNIPELEELVYHLHKIADTGTLQVTTPYGNMTSIVKSMVYRQMIYGFMKEPLKIKHNADYIVIASFTPLVVVTIIVFIISCQSCRSMK